MLTRFNFIARWIAGFLFGAMELSDKLQERIWTLRKSGTVILVQRRRSWVDTVVFNFLFLRAKLPVVRLIGGDMNLVWIGPIREIFKTFFRTIGLAKPLPPKKLFTERLAEEIETGRESLVFLAKGRSLVREFFSGNDPFPVIVKAARTSSRPIYLLPHYIIWDQTPGHTRATVTERMIGGHEEDTLARKVISWIKMLRYAKAECGMPVDVRAFIAQQDDNPSDREIVQRLKLELLHEFERERRVYSGPKLRQRPDMKAEILRDEWFVGRLLELAEESGQNREVLIFKANKMLDKMASDYSHLSTRALNTILTQAWKRMWDGIEADSSDFDKLREAMREGPVLLLPNHSSHADYLLLSTQLYGADIIVPHIAAGDNLSFWPLGPIFRGSGAFFMRRSFKGDKLYKLVFDAYLRFLLKEGYLIEFFIEGGRSRSGKMLPPKYGLLSSMIEHYFAGDCPRLSIIPVGVDYDRVFEENSYKKELEGAKKEKESVLALLKIVRFFGEKRGRVYVKFGEPLRVNEWTALRNQTMDDVDNRRTFTVDLADEIERRIQAERTATPTSLVCAALLPDPDRPVAPIEFQTRLELLLAAVRVSGMRLATPLAGQVTDALTALHDRLNDLASSKVIEIDEQTGHITFPRHTTLILDYYRNTLVNMLADLSLTSLSLLAASQSPVPAATSEKRFELIDTLLNDQFIRPRRMTSDERYQGLKSMGLVELTNGQSPLQTTIKDRNGLRVLASLVRTNIETAWLVTDCLPALDGNPMSRKDFTKLVTKRSQDLLKTGSLKSVESTSRARVDETIASLARLGIIEPGKEKDDIRSGPTGKRHQYLVQTREILDLTVPPETAGGSD